MTFSAAQQHLLQRLGITTLRLSPQFGDVGFVVSEDLQAVPAQQLPTLDWQPIPDCVLHTDLIKALELLLLPATPVTCWAHAQLSTPLWHEQQLYVPWPMTAQVKRQVWDLLSTLQES